MWSLDFAHVQALQEAGDWEAAGELLAGLARRVEDAGAELLVLCTNTMHRVAPAIEAATSIPLLHIAEATADALLAGGVTRRAAGHALHDGGRVPARALGARGIEGSCRSPRIATSFTR